MVSRFVAAESLANPYFSRFLPSHPALSRVSQISCLFTPGNSIRLTDAISDSAGNSGAADGTLVLNLEVVKVGNYWTAQFVIAPGSSGWDATRN